ncbi:MAG TPA: glycosyltransferase family 87 protein [Ktedonobacterales bacterium]|nr:glycosyltransferase family 87 protein [Ktedonobacterales bacterium]
MLLPVIAVLVAGMVGSFLGSLHLTLLSNSADFRIYYAAAKVWLSGGDPYRVDLLQRVDPTVSILGYVYPLWALLFIAPLTLLPLTQAAGIWLALNIEALLAVVLLLGRHLHIGQRWRLWLVIVGLLGLPGLFVLIQGQISFLLLLVLVTGYLCLQARKVAWAGSLLALSLLKPQLVWLPVALLFLIAFRQGQQKWLAGWFGLALGVLLGFSWLTDPSWLSAWIGALQRDSAIGDPGEQHVTDNMGTVFALAHHLPVTPLAVLLVIVAWLGAALLLLWRFRRAGNAFELFALGCVLVGILSPWMWIYDGVIWLVPLAALVQPAPSMRRGVLALTWYAMLPYAVRLFYFFFLSHLQGTSFNKVEDILAPAGLALLLVWPGASQAITAKRMVPETGEEICLPGEGT